ncbi:MAG: flagellar hook-basal body complex protein FliE [Eubacterium sp.]|nr:flagellar hook-basal body complex protein FliE [Eubacterium sp.]
MEITNVAGTAEAAFQAAQERFRVAAQENNEDFETVFQSALGMVNETNDLHNQAKSAMIQFALGESDNTHDLLIAQSKANVALQYTVAVKDKLIEGYREIMQMQI